jgi:hypothetical protein
MGSNGPRIGGGYIALWKLIDTKKITGFIEHGCS